MKTGFSALFLMFCVSLLVQAHTLTLHYQYNDTTPKKKDTTIFTPGDVVPEYPGGEKAFARYLVKNLEYPDVALLIGVDGSVFVQFVVERDGTLTDVTPVKCIGAGCESEAVKVVANSKKWKPGYQDNKPVRVQYTVPIHFTANVDKVTMRSLRKSDYGFLFEIKGTIYSVDDAEKLLGKSIKPTDIEIALPYYDGEKYPMPDKKGVYLIKMKS